MRKWMVGLGAGALAMALCGTLWAGGVSLDRSRWIPIQHDGQVMSWESFAHKTVELITEKARFERKPAWLVLIEAASRPDEIEQKRWIRINAAALRDYLGLEAGRAYFAYDEIAASMPKIVGLVQSAQAKRDKDERPLFLEQKAEGLYAKMIRVKQLATGDALKVIPPAEGDAWLSPAEGGARAERFAKLMLLARNGSADFEAEARAWIAGVHEAAGGRYESKISLEVFYYSLQPFHWAWLLYIAAFALITFGRTRPPLLGLGAACAVSAFACHTAGLALRVIILGRPPVSNMYESIIYMNWVLMLIAGLFAFFARKPAAAAVGAILSGAVMIYSDLLPIDSSLGVLVPVLRSNYWLSIHVMTIVSSYGVLGFAMGLGHRHLILWIRGRLTKKEEKSSETLIIRTIQIGTLLLGIGTVLGGVWANESWGRFWGWDPKETWALITFLGYLVLIHLYYKKWLNPFVMAMGAVLGFLLVLMTWYGVNFVLGRGLHSYGQGSGGTQWIVYYLAAEGLFLFFVILRSVATKNPR